MSNTDSPSLSGMKYQVESILSSDGPTTVMLVNDPKSFSKRYVIKRIARESEKEEALLALAEALPDASSKLNHAGVLKYYDYAVKKAWFKTTEHIGPEGFYQALGPHFPPDCLRTFPHAQTEGSPRKP